MVDAMFPDSVDDTLTLVREALPNLKASSEQHFKEITQELSKRLAGKYRNIETINLTLTLAMYDLGYPPGMNVIGVELKSLVVACE